MRAFIILTALLSVTFGPKLGAQSPVRLSDVQELAGQRATGVLTGKLQVLRSTAELETFRAELLPQVWLSGRLPSYQRTFSEITQPDGSVRFLEVNNMTNELGVQIRQAIPWTGGEVRVGTFGKRFDDFESDLTLYNNSVARMSLSQPLFGFNEWKYRRKYLPLQRTVEEAKFKEARYEAQLTATRLFFDLLDAQQNVAIAQDQLKDSRQLLTVVNKRKELGTISRSDRTQVLLEAEVAKADSNFSAQNRYLLTIDLLDFLGEPITDSSLVLVDTEALLTVPKVIVLPKIEQLLAAARQQRSEYTQKVLAKLDQERLEKRRRTELGPQAAFLAQVGIIGAGTTAETAYSNTRPEQFVGLTASIPILDWGRRSSERKRLSAEAETQNIILQRRIETLESRVLRVRARCLAAFERLGTYAEVRRLAVERYQITYQTYQLGNLPLNDLALARQVRDNQMRRYATGLREFYVSLAELEALTLLDLSSTLQN